MSNYRQVVGSIPKNGDEGVLTPKHDALVEFLLHNPTMKMRDVAAHFELTPSFLSIIVHSDLFQARLGQRREEYFGTIGRPIREKIMGVAARALDRLGEEVEMTLDGDFLLATADKLLGHVMPRGAPGVRPALALQQNFYGGQAAPGVSPKVLEDSRQLMLAASQVAVAEIVDPGDES